MPDTFAITMLEPASAAALVEPVLRSVPEWFGIESSTMMYVRDAGTMPTLGAVPVRARQSDDHAKPLAGFLSLKLHAPTPPLPPRSGEVHCMAVRKDMHGQGAGTALLAHAEGWLRAQGVRFLQVKTQGPSRPSAEYARTLRFYQRSGFEALEEIHGMWPGIPCLVMVKAL